MSFYNNSQVENLEGEIWKVIEEIDHDEKDYLISNFGRLKSRYKRRFFARKTAKRERLLTWSFDPKKKTHNLSVKNKSVYIFHSTRRHLMNIYFLQQNPL